jgi:TPR repeat protein
MFRGALAIGLFVACLAVSALATDSDTFKATASSVTELRSKADSGDEEAEYRLGKLYRTGEAEPLLHQDDVEAVKWYRKSAEQGYADAQVNLGLMLHQGAGGKKNDAEAIKWWRKAARQGNAGGEQVLGTAYYLGISVRQNYTQAEKWNRKAAEQDEDHAEAALGVMYHRGVGVPKDGAKALYWWRKAAEKDNPIAQAYLGNAYHDGEGVPKDDATAVAFWRKAAEKGNVLGQAYLGRAYMYGWGVHADSVTGYMWFSIALQGHRANEKDRTEIERTMLSYEMLMTNKQLEEAKMLAEQWRQKKGWHKASP